MRSIWRMTLFFFFSWLHAATAQSARQSIEQHLTQFEYDRRSYIHVFRFSEGPQSDAFTFETKEGDEYARFSVGFSKISAIDIVSISDDLALLLSFREPLKVDLRHRWKEKETRQERRQTLALPIQDYRKGLFLQHLFREVDARFLVLLSTQNKKDISPEMIDLPRELSRPYMIGKYPVTVDQYRAYCRAKQMPMPSPPNWGWQSEHPMVNVSWQEAKDYCIWLSQQTGQLYDLPNKDRWRYVAFDESEKVLDDVAWWGENASNSTHRVGQKNANVFGAHDMQGNVWEWLNAAEADAEAFLAGGSWDSHFEQCQWNSTVKLDKIKREFDTGFRIIGIRE